MAKKITAWAMAAAAIAMVQSPAVSQVGTPHFKADGGISGSSLTGLTQLGQAEWTVKNGEVTARAKAPAGGWLILDKPLSNLSFYAQVQCTGGCRAGVLLRAEKLPDGGLKGIFVSFSDADQGAYAVRIDSQGRETARTKLKAEASLGGLPSTMANTPPHVLDAMKTKRRADAALPPGVSLPNIAMPSGKYQPGGWNSLNLDLFEDALNPSVNGGRVTNSAIPQSIAPLEEGSYGPIALYVGGTGTARFKEVLFKDLLRREVPQETVSPNFDMKRLDGYFYSWSTAVADFNNDGEKDIAAGPWVYYGPDFKTAREIYTPVTYNPTEDYPQLSTVNLAYDFTGDGWADVINFTGNAGFITGVLHVNPGKEERPWKQYKVIELLANEETLLRDIDGDGVPEVIHGGPDYALGYTKPDPKNPTGPWITTKIAAEGIWGDFLIHGVGVGDINGDGRLDFLSPYGWWEHPADKDARPWKYHPVAFARTGISQGGAGGAELGVWDINGDGLNDVFSPLEGHGFGLAWYEQKRSKSGEISFTRHIIMDGFLDKNAGDVTFTQPHAVGYADMDGDGIKDLVTGKRPMSHLATWMDPDPYGAPVLYVYRVVRDKAAPGGARFEPELVHNFSGVGAHIQVEDLNKDGVPDIATSGPYGTFAFINKHKKQ